MRFLKIISLFIAIIFILCGCSDETANKPLQENNPATAVEENTETIEEEPFTLRIPLDFDEGVSPYTTRSKPNRFVCELIYRSMVSLTSDYRYELDLVSEIYTEDNIN